MIQIRADSSLQIGEVVTTIPTIGFNVESVTYKNLNFNVWVRCQCMWLLIVTVTDGD